MHILEVLLWPLFCDAGWGTACAQYYTVYDGRKIRDQLHSLRRASSSSFGDGSGNETWAAEQ